MQVPTVQRCSFYTLVVKVYTLIRKIKFYAGIETSLIGVLFTAINTGKKALLSSNAYGIRMRLWEASVKKYCFYTLTCMERNVLPAIKTATRSFERHSTRNPFTGFTFISSQQEAVVSYFLMGDAVLVTGVHKLLKDRSRFKTGLRGLQHELGSYATSPQGRARSEL